MQFYTATSNFYLQINDMIMYSVIITIVVILQRRGGTISVQTLVKATNIIYYGDKCY